MRLVSSQGSVSSSSTKYSIHWVHVKQNLLRGKQECPTPDRRIEDPYVFQHVEIERLNVGLFDGTCVHLVG